MNAVVQVVLFAVPGAFTPTCSLKHLPGFIEKAHELKVSQPMYHAGMLLCTRTRKVQL